MTKSSLLLSSKKEDSSFLKKRSKRLLIFLALWPGFAQAHAMLEGARPPVGGMVHGALPALQLQFSEGLEPRFCAVQVVGADGADRRDGALRTAPGNARTLIVPLKGVTPGVYVVHWHAVSVDTHRTEGTYSFTVSAG